MPDASSFLGHVSQKEALMRDLEAGNIAHAYLFEGARHIGKFTIAKWFAGEVLTKGITDEEERAKVISQIDRLLHPDLLVLDQLWIAEVCEDLDVIAKSSNVLQEHRKKAKLKTDTIGIDDVRSLHDRLIETGFGQHRLCLIRSVERMQAEAVNALLKILEEPPPGVVFILTTQSLPSLLPTIISRSRILRFAPLTASEMEPLLTGLEDEERGFLLRLSQGAPGIVKKLRSDPEALRKEKSAFLQARAFWESKNPAERLKLLAPLLEDGEEAERFLLCLALALRDMLPAAEAKTARYLGLLKGLTSNTSRPLLLQQFALADIAATAH